jgi:alginate O-acetyltransferase complex protein AlgI
MLFNSLSFGLFFPIVFILYWFVVNKNLKIQNWFLLIASYFFYSCWNWHFLFLLIFSTFLDYFTAHKIFESNTPKLKKIWLWVSIGINLGFLGVFKYYNFFISSFTDFTNGLGWHLQPILIAVILPVGISFYTFHGISYVIDVYYDRIKPTHNWVDYSLFVSFFPLLVAGPIERATHLLPQVQSKRIFDYTKVVSGLRQILWGLFKKMVIADNCAEAANTIFNSPSDYHGLTLILGALMFTVQIYGDFSGYSDIALGAARMLGFELLQNFSFPYFSRNMAEFWRRWHISLSSWFRDYVYIPLGGSKGTIFQTILNTFIIFLVSGFWHGANWTFIFWGGLNALLILPNTIIKTKNKPTEIVAKGKLLPSPKEALQLIFTFGLITFTWIFFRANTISDAFIYLKNIGLGIGNYANFTFSNVPVDLKIYPLVVLFFVIEWIGRENRFALENLGNKWHFLLRWFFYLILVYAIFYLAGEEQQFVYFQF